ncbi:PKD domain-containing protein [Bizionia arctica]|uniref:PKD domain-containing protein n=1 Tax=Bizionia arctica TaxID=1495645 RepID=A0A917LR79_9FLAO|nr:PKD domain-containing protein [Bizionia arctica]GGG52357.1 hypothetical protein GCM10010976_24370 [Bizionia arctica]
MKKSKYIYFGFVFLIIVSSAIAYNNVNVFSNSKIVAPSVTFTFNNNNTCSGQSVSFNSTVSGNGPFEYSWNFGDGTPLNTTANPNHVFQAFGCGNQNFNVTLTVTDNNDEIGANTQTVIVKQKPNISFEDLNQGFGDPFDNCNAATIDYTVLVGNISSSGSCVSSYSVNWGDGNSENNVSFPLSHTYQTLGSFNMVISGLGSNGCQAQKVYLVKNSSNPTGGIVTPGNTVNLCTPINPLQFAISNWGENPPDTIYNVDFGDGTTFTLTQNDLESSPYYNSSNPSASANYPIPHTYTESNCPNNSYTILLDVVTSCGVSNLTAGPITILEKPEVSFDVTDPECVGENIQLNNTSSTGYNQNCTTNANWFWDMGDGSTYSDFEPVHSYSAPGTYTISLYAENYCGSTDPVTQQICIEAPINPEFTSNNTEGCAPFTTVLNNSTSLADQCGVPTFEWVINYTPSFCGTTSGFSFINGTDANSQNPQIEFTNPGTYEAILQGTNSCGIANSIPQEIFVKSPPQVGISEIANFCGSSAVVSPMSTVDSCGPDPVTYQWSLDVGVSPTDWEFINGTNENSENPEISFITSNSYVLSLEVTTSCGTSIDTESFVISPVPILTNTDLDQTLCSGALTDEIVLVSNNSNTTYQWTGTSPSGNISGFIPSGTSNNIPSHILTLNSGTIGTVTYTVTPYLVSDCPGDPIQFTITVNAGPSIDTQPVSGTYCLDAVAEVLTLVLSNNTTGTPTYQWYVNDSGIDDPADPNTTAIPSPEGTQANYLPPTDTLGTLYYFCVISLGGTGSCSEITTIPVAVIVTPNIIISDETPLNQIICSGANADELSFNTNNGGAGTISYNWYLSDDNIIDNADTQVGTNSTYNPGVLSTPGIYYYYVTIDVDENLGCSDVSSEIYSIEVLEDPVVTITPVDQTICNDAPVDLLIAQVSGGIDVTNDGNIDNADYEFQWFLNGTAVTEVNDIDGDPSTFGHDISLPAGVYNYYCEISQPNSLDCNATSNIATITVSQGASISTQPLEAIYCLGDTIADLEVIVSNGVGTPDYQWFSNDTNDTVTPNPIGTNSSTLTVPNTNVGLFYYYCVISFSEGGCSELTTQIISITINQVPEISDYNDLICSNNSFSIIPDNSNGDIVPLNTTYTWSTPIVNPIGAITGALEELTATTSISQLLENTTTNPATVTYTVTPRSGDCIGDVFEILITVNPSITVIATVNNNSCFESNNASIEIDVTGGVPFPSGNPYTISWSGPNGFTSSDEDITNLEIGTYVLDIIDDGGCPYSETFIITEPEVLVFGAINFDPETITCFGANDGSIDINIEGGNIPYVYTWTLNGSPFSTTEDLTDLGPGNYEVTVTDINNCGPVTQSFTIVEPPLLEVSLAMLTNVICFGDATGAVDINVVGGRPIYSYVWTGPNGFTSSMEDVDNLVAGTYTVTITDSSGCLDTLDFIITQNDEISIDVTTTEIECYGDNDASITINNISGGIPPYTIAWSNFGTGMQQTNLSAGIYTITITDAINCSKSFPIEIEEAPIFLIDPVVTQMSCSGENDASIILNFQGGMAPITVVWNDDSSAGVERNNLAPGTYSVTITDGTPCVIQDSFTIFNILPLQLSANVTHALDCDDINSGSINLLIAGGTPPFNVDWSNGATTEDLNSIPPNTYHVTVTDAHGCQIEGNWEVNRFEPLVLDVDIQSEVDCVAKTVDQTFVALASGGVPPFQFTWSSGTVSGLNNEMMTTDVNGLVVLEVLDSQGCTTNFSFNVEIPVLGDPNFEISSFGYTNYGVYAIQDPIQFTNTATGDFVSILWDFGDGNFSSEVNPIHTYLQVGNYVVTQTVTYPFGCVYSNIITLIVEKGYKLIMPDAFTPNDDGLNDFFGPEYIGLKKMKLNIYDTWGSLIYSESGDDLQGWNGKVRNEEAENGNYYYAFIALTFYNDEIEEQGPVVIIK